MNDNHPQCWTSLVYSKNSDLCKPFVKLAVCTESGWSACVVRTRNSWMQPWIFYKTDNYFCLVNACECWERDVDWVKWVERVSKVHDTSSLHRIAMQLQYLFFFRYLNFLHINIYTFQALQDMWMENENSNWHNEERTMMLMLKILLSFQKKISFNYVKIWEY